MGTRSSITVKCNDGKFRTVYCHWDGYISWNGRYLVTHYNSQEQAETLVRLGDISSLRSRIATLDEITEHTFEKPLDDVTVPYSLRGDVTPDKPRDKLMDSIECRVGIQPYNYVYDGRWYLLRTNGSESAMFDLIHVVDTNTDE